jgi:hypothetical protein
VLQLWNDGQSVATLQPHKPPVTHACPCDDMLQSPALTQVHWPDAEHMLPPGPGLQNRHAPPERPHACCELPCTHNPLLQQPPWQLPLQAVLQVWLIGSHA